MDNVLIATLPSLIIAVTTIVLVWRMLSAHRKDGELRLKEENLKVMTPIRMRAYERMALFIERINPNSLLMRQNLGNNVTALTLQRELLKQIRQEWEHNAAQQIYIETGTWNKVVNAKESIVELVNMSLGEIQNNTVAVGLATMVLEAYNKTEAEEDTALQVALEALRKDVAKY